MINQKTATNNSPEDNREFIQSLFGKWTLYGLPVILVLLSAFGSSAQSTYQIAYKHWFQKDTTKQLNNAHIRDASLIGNSLKSIYIYNIGSEKLKDTIKVDFRNFQELISAANEGKVSGTQKATIPNGIPFDEFGNQIYFDKTSDSIFSRIKMVKEYTLIAEKNKTINWELTDETKNIQGYNCKKATGFYKGRNYIAWFTPEIPIPEGPYKFKGLPGLILEIEDTRGELKIWAETIQYPAKTEIPTFMASGRPITYQAYLAFLAHENEAIFDAMISAIQTQPGYNMVEGKPLAKKINSFCQIELSE